jgi:hypothetical protein
MPDTTAVPLTITPEATARIAELGMQAEFEQMLEHTRQTVAGLRALRVSLQEPYDLGGGPVVIIDATVEEQHSADDPTGSKWGLWLIRTYPPQVCENFFLFCVPEVADAR